MATGFGIASLLTTVAGTAISTVAQINQAEAQSRQAEANADAALQNAKLAEEEAQQKRREGYENKLKKRQEVTGIISSQRAAQGASGALVDSGSFMDTMLDTVDKGEADALKLEQQGFDAAYQKDLEAYNYKNQAAQYRQQASDLQSSKTGALATGGLSILGSAAQFGSNWFVGSSAAKPKTLMEQYNKGTFKSFH